MSSDIALIGHLQHHLPSGNNPNDAAWCFTFAFATSVMAGSPAPGSTDYYRPWRWWNSTKPKFFVHVEKANPSGTNRKVLGERGNG